MDSIRALWEFEQNLTGHEEHQRDKGECCVDILRAYGITDYLQYFARRDAIETVIYDRTDAGGAVLSVPRRRDAWRHEVW